MVVASCTAIKRRRTANGLNGSLSPYREAPHAPALAVIVVHRVVLRAAVVPDGERARRPAHAAGELRPGLMLRQEIKQRGVLLFRHSLDERGVAAARVELLPAGLLVDADYRVFRSGFVRVF